MCYFLTILVSKTYEERCSYFFDYIGFKNLRGRCSIFLTILVSKTYERYIRIYTDVIQAFSKDIITDKIFFISLLYESHLFTRIWIIEQATSRLWYEKYRIIHYSMFVKNLWCEFQVRELCHFIVILQHNRCVAKNMTKTAFWKGSVLNS